MLLVGGELTWICDTNTARSNIEAFKTSFLYNFGAENLITMSKPLAEVSEVNTCTWTIYTDHPGVNDALHEKTDLKAAPSFLLA